MKRSRPKQKVSDYQIQFDAMKPSVHLRSGGLCEAKHFAKTYIGSEGTPEQAEALESLYRVQCAVRGNNVHHRKYRIRGGTNFLGNLLELDLNCHSWIHAHGKFGGPANILGLALSEGESEEI